MNYKKIIFFLTIPFLILLIACSKDGSSTTNQDDISPSEVIETDTITSIEEEIEPVNFEGFVNKHGQLRVSGTTILDKNDSVIQLRGMSLFWSQWMGQFYNKEAIKWLVKDWNISVIRASMGVEDNGGYLTNKITEKEKVFKVIEAAIEEGIYVIVDWHSHHAEDHLEEAKLFLAEVAEKYGDYPNIIYETYNEPLDVSWTEVLKPYHEAVIAEIRKHDTNNIIVCGTRTWSQRVDEVIGNTIDDPNVMYTLHYYSSTHKDYLRSIAQQALDSGIPLFVTEFGLTEASGDGEIDVESAQLWWKFLDDNNISWCNWSIADKDEKSAALRPGANAEGQWTDAMLTTSGLMVKTEIVAKNTTN